ncbi:hypothetical protein B5D80_19715 [Micromonospora wenchangensis]|uniref:Uncharacterized protein n=1 Tax=Micromonospora wenchangensis TaxID=1185415 RepID=A0A246RJ21_9ACTN|nr:tetratricopeptide repeat protein [Micromonospora wenchangensis]OWV04721.1 hypothetical protein B5D80_19715 [Micromonospora wenchangensis]
MADLEQRIAGDDRLDGAPKRDLIHRIISWGGPASLDDVRAVARTLARACGQDEYAVAGQVTQITDPSGHAPTAQAAQRPQMGLPVDACNPLALEVHPAIELPDERSDALPVYVSRPHDAQLREVADQVVAQGSSRLLTVVGGSSTGKTRACWELVQYLDQQQPGRWRVWHPYDPTRPQAALADLDQVGACTVVWLNEAQHYLMPTDRGLGERIAAGLRTLVHDPLRGPVLVLATLWPQYWDALTFRPGAGEPDLYAQARELLTGTAVTIAARFTQDQVAALTAAGIDPRVRYAAEHAEDGRITQYLAGAPDLENRYRTASSAARALIQVAIDARRLGHPLPLPHALLERAAPGYLDDHDWDQLDEDWLEAALAETAKPCKGARGPLTRVRPRPGESPALSGAQPCYRLADYLEQLGRVERAAVYPPESLWIAFTSTLSDPSLLRSLGHQAELSGRYQQAIWLYTKATRYGDPEALESLVELRERAGDIAGAQAMLQEAADCGHPGALQKLAMLRERTGDIAGAEVLAVQAADCGRPSALVALAQLREQAGDAAGAEVLLQQAVDRGVRGALVALAQLREQAGDASGAKALLQQAVDEGVRGALDSLILLLERAGDTTGARALIQQVTDRSDPSEYGELAFAREQVGDTTGADAMALQAADHGLFGVAQGLAMKRSRTNDIAGAEALMQQLADRGHPNALRELAVLRRIVGDIAGAEALMRQAADRGVRGALVELARLRKLNGDIAGAEALLRQAADHGHFGALLELAILRWSAGDIADAERVLQEAADRGDPTGLQTLIEWRREDGDRASSDRMRRFGLTASGEIATTLDFDL